MYIVIDQHYPSSPEADVYFYPMPQHTHGLLLRPGRQFGQCMRSQVLGAESFLYRPWVLSELDIELDGWSGRTAKARRVEDVSDIRHGLLRAMTVSPYDNSV